MGYGVPPLYRPRFLGINFGQDLAAYYSSCRLLLGVGFPRIEGAQISVLLDEPLAVVELYEIGCAIGLIVDKTEKIIICYEKVYKVLTNLFVAPLDYGLFRPKEASAISSMLT